MGKKKWRKLHTDLSPKFRALPYVTQALGVRLLAEAEEGTGRLAFITDGCSPAQAVRRAVGAGTADRQLFRWHIPKLIDTGFLEVRDGYVSITNFGRYQQHQDHQWKQEDTARRPDDKSQTTRGQVEDNSETSDRQVPDNSGTSARQVEDNSGSRPKSEDKCETSDRQVRDKCETTIAKSTELFDTGSRLLRLELEEIKDPKKESTNSSPSADDIRSLFDFWRDRTGRTIRTVLTDDRRRRLKKALKAYGPEMCQRAVEGAMLSPFHCGDNEHGTKYLGIEHIFKPENVERFNEYVDNPPRTKRPDDAHLDAALRHAKRGHRWN